MRGHGPAAFLILALASPPPLVAGAQPGPGTLEVLLQEVRLLRQAIERQGAFQAHVQLLSGRLALQDQRVGRLRARADGLQAETEDARRSREQMRATLAEIRERRDAAADYEERQQLELELGRVERFLAEAESRLADLEARRAGAQLELEAAQARYGELEAFFDQLDRELNRMTK